MPIEKYITFDLHLFLDGGSLYLHQNFRAEILPRVGDEISIREPNDKPRLYEVKSVIHDLSKFEITEKEHIVPSHYLVKAYGKSDIVKSSS